MRFGALVRMAKKLAVASTQNHRLPAVEVLEVSQKMRRDSVSSNSFSPGMGPSRCYTPAASQLDSNSHAPSPGSMATQAPFVTLNQGAPAITSILASPSPAAPLHNHLTSLPEGLVDTNNIGLYTAFEKALSFIVEMIPSLREQLSLHKLTWEDLLIVERCFIRILLEFEYARQASTAAQVHSDLI